MNHLEALRALPCCACGGPGGFAHHAQGGSMLERVGARGGRKHSDWLALPLCHLHHQGTSGIHTIGVKTWESIYGAQTSHLDHIGNKLWIDLWAKAEQEAATKRANRKSKPMPKINAWRK